MSDKPERPTCATCPYWTEDSESLSIPLDGYCRRWPPVIVPCLVDAAARERVGGKIASLVEYGEEAGDPFVNRMPCTNADDWCGEHPDFPAWIKATRG